MPIVNGKKYPYTDSGKQAAFDAASNSGQPIRDVMSEIDGGPMSNEIDGGPMSTASHNMKSKLKPYKLKRGLT